ncbi:ankyrin repeat-containing domain protein [Truncatella angustata]|uniref:Ankyrin repeat-containing domain protein n=1 Tax=Truncatella angustata TaxID=152316 RepID=A0A9P8RKS1_9PEZI|nr:ankyrin repeat-containing domain protein [Truncatella angustata]KAH6647699.1 ankyrin repeat-containing domain protein [Truncatella angustata]
MFTDDPYVTALHTACELGSVEMCGHLIDSLYQTNLEAKDHVGRTPLVYAYYNENWSCIDYLISMGATINTKCGPFSLFQHACNYGQFAEANRLLELGADIDVTFSTPGDETSSLACCCYGGRLERRNKLWNDRAERQSHLRVKVTQLLIDRKVDIEKGWKDSTPLMEAAASHLSELVELLLSAGADANVEDANSNSALVKACQSTSSSMPGPMLRTVLALLNCKPKRAQCRVALAALCNTKDLEHNTDRETAAQLLLDYAGNSSIARSVGQSLLASSIVNGNTGLAATWAGLGVKPTKKMIQTIARRAIETEFSSALEYVLDNFRGSAPLLLSGHLLLKALAAGSKLCAIVLLMRGSQFDVRSEEGETCLFLACQSKGTSLADMLLVRGADPNSCNDDGTYPLLPAIANENRKLIALLMKHGAMIHHDPSGLQGSPLDLAIMLGKANVVREIIAQEAYWDSTKQERSAHLRVACTNPAGHFEDEHILYTLINAGGVDIDSPIATGLFAATPLHFAIAAENNSAIKVLMKEGAKIHRKISGQPIERQPGTDSAGGAEDLIAGTTPMEFALKCGDVAIATMMMDDEEHTASSAHRYMLELDDVYVPWIEHTDDVPIVDYVKAVCHRHNQSLLARLLTRGISPNIQDAHGKTPIMLLCEAWDKHGDDPAWAPGAVASRIGKCIGMLFHNRVGANPSICDKKGKSGLDYIRQRMASTEVTDHWNDAFVIEGDSVKSLL